MHVSTYAINDAATTDIYPLSLHDALPISMNSRSSAKSTISSKRDSMSCFVKPSMIPLMKQDIESRSDRKSTRLNSSHSQISYAVFCLKKKILCIDYLAAPSKTF